MIVPSARRSVRTVDGAGVADIGAEGRTTTNVRAATSAVAALACAIALDGRALPPT